MKIKCKTLYLFLIICVISFIIVIIFFNLKENNESLIIFELIYDISIGIFGSSFVVFLLAIPEYKTAKKQTLDQIWYEFYQLINKFSNIKPFVAKYDETLIEECLNEWNNNKNHDYVEIMGIKNDKSNELKKIIKSENEYKGIKNKKELDELLDYAYNNEMKQMEKQIHKRMKEYQEVNNLSMNKINELLGDVQFFSGKKEFKRLFNEIYTPIKKMINIISFDLCRHIDIYNESEKGGRIDIICNIISNIQTQIFSLEEKNSNNRESKIYYNKFVDKLTEKIEKYRAEVIYHEKAQKFEKYPVLIISKTNKNHIP